MPSRAACAVALGIAGTGIFPGTGWAAPGDPDTTFGANGRVLTPFLQNGSIGWAVAAQPDGKLVAAGQTTGGEGDPAVYGAALGRYRADGSLDPDFGTGGKVITSQLDQANAVHVAVRPDGKLVVAGSAYTTEGEQTFAGFAAARYLADGTLDSTFGDGGSASATVGVDHAAAQAAVMQPDGKLVVAGWSQEAVLDEFGACCSLPHAFGVVRFGADGGLDSGFGTGGKVLTTFGSGDGLREAYAQAVALQPDGKIIVVGRLWPGGAEATSDMAVARYLPDGSLDSTFGAGGRVLTHALDGSAATAVVVQPNGKVVVGGDAWDAFNGNMALIRLDTNGALDPTFGIGGKAQARLGDGSNMTALALQPDGKLVAAGQSGSYIGTYTVARFDADGSLDEGFGNAGFVTAGARQVPRDVIVLPDSRIVTAGSDPATCDQSGTCRGQFMLASWLGDSDPGAPAAAPPVQNGPVPPAPAVTGYAATLSSATGLRVQAIDVTQGTQHLGLPPVIGREPAGGGIGFEHNVANLHDPEMVSRGAYGISDTGRAYNGVGFVRGRPTVARVFVAGTPDARVHLYGFRDGKPLIGSPVLAAQNADPAFFDSKHPYVPPDLGDDAALLKRKAANSNGAYTFVLPTEWTEGVIKLVAVALPAGEKAAACRSCSAQNALALEQVAFTPTRKLYVALVPIDIGDGPGDALPRFMEITRGLLPVEDVWVNSVKSPIVVARTFEPDGKGGTKETTSYAALARLHAFIADQQLWGYEIVLGAAPRGLGLMGWGRPPFSSTSVGVGSSEDDRILSGMTHEVMHGFGAPHTDAAAANGGCDGNSATDTWASGFPAGNKRGAVLGAGLNLRIMVGLSRNFRVEPPRAELDPVGGSDLMSYCNVNANAHDDNKWLSPFVWDDMLSKAAVAQSSAAGKTASTGHAHASVRSQSAGVRGPAFNVVGYETAAGVTLDSVRLDADGGPALPGGDGARFDIVARDRAGRAVATTTARGRVMTDHSGAVNVSFQARVPAAGVAAIEVVLAGEVRARRVRSAHAPAVKLLRPRRRARLGGRRPSLISWRSTDADGDARQAIVDYSVDGGRRWQTIYTGPDRGRVKAPASWLPASRRARIRVRIDDGFNQTIARSGPLSSSGTPPSVRILQPAQRSVTIPAGAVVVLEADARDDSGKPLSERRVTWFDGRRRITTGTVATLRGLKAGTHRVRVLARDVLGRRAQARLTVKVVGKR